MLTTKSQQHDSHDNMIFACQHSLRHRDGQWTLQARQRRNDGKKMGGIEAEIVGILWKSAVMK